MNKTEFIFIVVITAIVVVIWVASSIIHQQSASVPNPDAKKYLDPVDPNFDKKTLDKINSITVATGSANPIPLPSPTASASPSATPRPTATPRATASSSASPRPSASSLFP